MGPDFQGYVIILNPDHPEYDQRLSMLETDFEMISGGYCDTKCGFLEELGEVGRIGMFDSDISINEIQNVWNGHLEHKFNQPHLLWNLITFFAWHERYSK
mgnify:CR=1 FL=1